MTCCGRLFHTRDAVIGNDRSPTVVRRVRRMTSIDDDAEQSLHRARETAGRLSSSARYGGADPCTHLNTSTASLMSLIVMIVMNNYHVVYWEGQSPVTVPSML